MPASVTLVPAENGDPATGARVPLDAMANPEIVPSAPFPTYKKPAVGDTAIDCGLAAVGKGDPAIWVRSPCVGSTLNADIEAEPWLSTYRNVPAELMPTPLAVTVQA